MRDASIRPYERTDRRPGFSRQPPRRGQPLIAALDRDRVRLLTRARTPVGRAIFNLFGQRQRRPLRVGRPGQPDTLRTPRPGGLTIRVLDLAPRAWYKPVSGVAAMTQNVDLRVGPMSRLQSPGRRQWCAPGPRGPGPLEGREVSTVRPARRHALKRAGGVRDRCSSFWAICRAADGPCASRPAHETGLP